MAISARQKLIDAVVSASESDTWDKAIWEWNMIGCRIDYKCSSNCICGQERIKYLFTIENEVNDNVLFPIGSRCIKKFGRKDLDEYVNIHEQMGKLLEAVRKHSFIIFDSELFSKKLLRYLYEDDAFPATPYNGGDPRRDYNFLLEMFNSRSAPTPNQKRKIDALILNAIIPYCRSQIDEGI